MSLPLHTLCLKPARSTIRLPASCSTAAWIISRRRSKPPKNHLGKPFKAALGGGIFANYPEYTQAVIENAPKGCEMIVVNDPPVYGSALQAMWQVGDEPGDDFKENFLKSYAASLEG